MLDNNISREEFINVDVIKDDESCIYGRFPNGVTFPISRNAIGYCKEIASLKGIASMKAKEALRLADRFRQWQAIYKLI
jgi:hypothetical protein